MRFGGGGYDNASDVAVDSTGQAYVVGTTDSADFPTTEPALRPTSSVLDVLLSRVDSRGQAFVQSIRFGGSGIDQGFGVALAPTGAIYVVGSASSSDLPLAAPSLMSGTGQEGLLARIERTPLDPAAARTGGNCLCHDPAPNHTIPQPVNTRTGNFWTSSVDLQVEGDGPAIVWTRLYASQAITDTQSGISPGWHHPYAARLEISAQEVTVISGYANRERFRAVDGVHFSPAPGIYSALAYDTATGMYTQTLRDQQQLIADHNL